MSSQIHSKGKERAVEVLEVEDEEERHTRMHDLLTRLNTSSQPASSSGTRPFDFGDRSTFAVQPPLELLSRIQAFLPELAASNAELLRRAKEDPSSIDIENIDADEQQYIEMNLGVGVFDHRGEVPAGIPVADVDIDLDQEDTAMDSSSSSSTSASSSDSDSSSDTSSSDSSDSDSDSDPSHDMDADESEDVNIDFTPSAQAPPAAVRPIKPLPRRRPGQKPEIVVLSESNHRSP
ncbi:hypothetical protein C8Q76DRAFT_317690 [Earliella scabrosa]|nr:hypothetical protein C8Q76DRAFT_317690 [Earliella scabrosa]